MWAPDIRTLFFILFLIDVFLTVFLYLFWKHQKTYAGFRFWMLSLFAISSGYGLILSQGFLPRIFSVVLANLLIMLAIILRVDSIRQFVWNESLPRLTYGILLPVALVYASFTFVIDSILLRSLVLSVIIITFTFLGSIYAITGTDSETWMSRAGISLLFLILAGTFLFREIFWLAVPGPHTLLDTDIPNLLFMVANILTDILTTGLFIMMNMSRYQTELYKSEEKFRAIFDQTFQFTGLVSPAGVVLKANRTALDFSGIEESDATGKFLWETPWWSHSPALREKLKRAIGEAAKGTFIRFEATHPARDGTLHTVDFSLKPVTDEAGKVVLIIPEGRDITERIMAEQALARATVKLNVLNLVTFTDIQNAVFTLNGYFELAKRIPADQKLQQILLKQQGIVRNITASLQFARHYQDLGQKPPVWQDIRQTFLMGISHLDTSTLSRSIDVGNLEIYADPLLENVFFSLAENVIQHSVTATTIALRSNDDPAGLTLVFEDDGSGIAPGKKERIFDRRYEDKKGMGLFLVREILGITEITITETGEPGKGARFEMHVPKNAYRFRDTTKPGASRP